MILLPQLPGSWDYRCVPSQLAWNIQFLLSYCFMHFKNHSVSPKLLLYALQKPLMAPLSNGVEQWLMSPWHFFLTSMICARNYIKPFSWGQQFWISNKGNTRKLWFHRKVRIKWKGLLNRHLVFVSLDLWAKLFPTSHQPGQNSSLQYSRPLVSFW
jgi:hypothetical protein